MRGLLLDTHAFVWTIVAPTRLSKTAYDAIVSVESNTFVSAASVYEIEYKRPRESLFEKLPYRLPEVADQLEIGWLPITVEDAERAGQLSRHHRDPWDRVLVAQAINHDLILVTTDTRIHQIAPAWGVDLLW